jgi:hypothetical protein
MGLRDKLRRLQKAAEGEIESFELLDGSRYYFDVTAPMMFMHFMDCLHAGSAHNWPEPPELLRKVCEAKDVEAALRKVGGGTFIDIAAYDRDVLIGERRLQPASFVSRYDPKVGKHVPIDPYEAPGRDLSE